MHGNSVRFPATSERDKRERTHEMGEAQYTQLEAEPRDFVAAELRRHTREHRMNSFGWPAKLNRTKGGVKLSFADWPDITETATTVQEAVLRAKDSLNHAVMLRINAGTSVPPPSNLQPGQVLIPITEDLAVRLQAYAEERDTQLFRETAEVHRVQRDLRAAFLAERQAYVEPIERLIERTDAGASEYASIGIRFCYILNAGGLIAVPAIMEILPDTAIGASKMLVPAFTFVGGVFLAATTNYLAYHSMIKASESHSYQASATGKEVFGMYFPPEDQTDHDAEIAQDRFDREDNREKAAFWANKAKVTFCLSIGGFFAGVLFAIHGLS